MASGTSWDFGRRGWVCPFGNGTLKSSVSGIFPILDIWFLSIHYIQIFVCQHLTQRQLFWFVKAITSAFIVFYSNDCAICWLHNNWICNCFNVFFFNLVVTGSAGSGHDNVPIGGINKVGRQIGKYFNVHLPPSDVTASSCKRQVQLRLYCCVTSHNNFTFYLPRLAKDYNHVKFYHRRVLKTGQVLISGAHFCQAFWIVQILNVSLYVCRFSWKIFVLLI